MIRSVRWRLILNSLLVTLVAILAVGVVTLLLIDRYFLEQERQYLAQNADSVLPTFVPLLRDSGSNDLQRVVLVTALIGDVRVTLLNADEEILADSGPRDPEEVAHYNSNHPGQRDIIFRINESGTVSAIETRREWIPDAPLAYQHELSISAESPITSISEQTLTIPLQVGDSIIGFLRLSEGPAAGSGVIASIQTALVWGSIAALIVAVLVGLLSANQIIRPLNRLEVAASQMAEANLQARAPMGKLREFNRVGDQLNQMAEQLSGTIEQLEEERTVLRRMIADASHELRTPLTALTTFNALLEDEVSTSNAREFVGQSKQQIQQLYRMTTGLLDLSRLEARISGTDFVSADLRNTVATVIETYRPFADSQEQQLTLSQPPQPVLIRHDPEAIQQALGNIVQNSTKYAGRGSKISVTVLDSDMPSIEVRDNGPGISAEALPNIFNRFYRDPIQKGEGTGLGLAIAKEIITIHGGTITTTSDHTGTCFTISF